MCKNKGEELIIELGGGERGGGKRGKGERKWVGRED